MCVTQILPQARIQWLRCILFAILFRTPRVCIGGTGALYLLNDKKWKRDLLDIVKASDRGQVSPRIVTAHLANLNHEVHLGVTDKSVGPRCIVAWRHRKDGIHKGGGGHHFYTGTAREGSSASLPMIANGMDVRAIIGAIMPHITKTLEEQLAGKPVQGIDKAVLNAELARLPDKPNEDLP